MWVCVRLRFTVNRRFGSHAVLTGSPGTIALSDPSDWVHMRIKTLSLPRSELFLFPFSPLSCSLLCRSLSLSLSLPLLTFFLCLSSPHTPRFLFISLFNVVPGMLAFASLALTRAGSPNICLFDYSQSICHQGVHRHTLVPWPSGNFEVRVLHAAVFKSQLWCSEM